MLRDDPNYRRVPVGSRSPLGSASYWLARDHLLVVEVVGITERYRRFDLRDIQATVVGPSRTRLTWNLVFGGLLVPAGLTAGIGLAERLGNGIQFSGVDGLVALVIFGTGTLALLVALAVNSLRGPGGRVLLTTAVQTLALPGISRWKQAERLLAELAPAIRAAQESAPAGVVAGAARAEPSGPTEPSVAETSS